MGALEESQAHLRKAKEFLTAAGLEVDLELYSAAASSAVLAGINAKDAICLRLTGRTGKSDDHRSAVPELPGWDADSPDTGASRNGPTRWSANNRASQC